MSGMAMKCENDGLVYGCIYYPILLLKPRKKLFTEAQKAIKSDVRRAYSEESEMWIDFVR
jgi:hypothetical protein